MSPSPVDRASTPNTVRRESIRLPQGVRESSALKTSSPHLRESKSHQDLRVTSPVSPGSPIPYRSNPAKHILDSGTPLRDENGATRDVKQPRTSYQPGRASRPGTADTRDTSNAAKENAAPEAAPKKGLPVYKSQAKQMLEAHEAYKSGKSVRQLEMATKTTAEMHTEMMQLFNECKVCLSALFPSRVKIAHFRVLGALTLRGLAV